MYFNRGVSFQTWFEEKMKKRCVLSNESSDVSVVEFAIAVDTADQLAFNGITGSRVRGKLVMAHTWPDLRGGKARIPPSLLMSRFEG